MTLTSLEGRRVRGLVALWSRALALSVEGTPRAFLWILLEPKGAAYAVAGDLPTHPDPRGSRFQALEAPLRGAAVVEAATMASGGFRLELEGSGEGERPLTLSLEPDGGRANLTLLARTDRTVLWAYRREPEKGPSRVPARIHAARDDSERQALRKRIVEGFRAEFEAEVKRMLDAAEQKLLRRIEETEEDKRRAAEMREDRRRAEILLANYGKIQRGASRVGLPDPFADSLRATVEIDLDPALSPDENAARLFRRAKRGERGEALANERIAETQSSLRAVQELRRRVSPDAAKETLEAIRSVLAAAKLIPSARGDVRETHLGRQAADVPRAKRPGRGPTGARESIRPRTFTTSQGWEVWVGRNNTDNDLITHRLSNPHDFWFHVVGVPGSHVILRRPTRNSIPKPTTLVEAAQIAAYFSKARKLTRVPVIYTERKFVTRPKRAKPGQALCTRERELLVRPRKPGHTSGTDGNDREVSS